MSYTDGVTIETVDDLYAQFERLNVPAFYANGGRNPLAGRTEIIPRTAKHYTMIHERDEKRLPLARTMMKALSSRRRVREILCDKADVNFNQYSPAGKVVVLYA